MFQKKNIKKIKIILHDAREAFGKIMILISKQPKKVAIYPEQFVF